jgi:hypothetical protein
MRLRTTPYREQEARWPREGRHILAQFDDEGVVVYQAYSPAIGRFAVEHGYFGGDDFSLTRMSWIKPNFLWMMFRCGWATKENQEMVLAITLRSAAFNTLLGQAVPSTFVPEQYPTREVWQEAVSRSSVRLQWDPDHAPNGAKLERRAIQLGLRGDVLGSYAREWILSIEDITGFVRVQHAHVATGRLDDLLSPREEPYPVGDETARWLGMRS